ncbi:hypothetical protein CONLIGDRAFT_710369, partial [Coniochaeta ligniaria NRRL 30616]
MGSSRPDIEYNKCPARRCNEMFLNNLDMQSHLEQKHPHMRTFPFPYEDCEVVCKSQHALHLHQRSEHLKLEFPCPMEGRSKTLTLKLGIKQHVKAVHEGIGFPRHEEVCAKIL